MICDADLTTDPDDLAGVYEVFASGAGESVNGTRFVYPQADRAMRWPNYMGNRAFTILMSLVLARRISDTLCGTKAFFRLDVLHMRQGRDPWGDYDLLFGAAQLRLSLRELPRRLPPHDHAARNARSSGSLARPSRSPISISRLT